MRPIPVIVMLGMIVTPVTPQALAEGSNLAVCSQPDPEECLDMEVDMCTMAGIGPSIAANCPTLCNGCTAATNAGNAANEVLSTSDEEGCSE